MAKKQKDATDAALEVLDRIDDTDEDLDSDVEGDPQFEAMLVEESIPSNRRPVWVHQSAIPEYKGQGYREAKAGEGAYQLLSGLTFEEGETPRFRDHVLMDIDRERIEKREKRERLRNREARARMTDPKSVNQTVYVNSSRGGGPRAMQER